jgi:HEAT repeat protein
MTDERSPVSTDPTNPYAPPTGSELLPPVEPPSAGFIVQLFVVPAFIVIVILGVWLTFNSLVRRTSPEKIIEGIESGPSVARWQRASELANILRDERYAAFKRSPESATKVARILERELEEAKTQSESDDQEMFLRYFLARALGKFEVTEGLDVLVKAAETKRNPSDLLVRHGALEAIAERVYTLQQLDPPQELPDDGVESALVQLSQDEEPQIRSDAAFALGQLGTPAAIERLEVLVNDPDPDARYNAAVALAHRGNEKSIETLAEMLDPAETAGLQKEKDDKGREFKRAVIVSNALRATEALHQKNPDADLALLTKSLEQLSDADAKTLSEAHLPNRVRIDARHVLDKLKKPGQS